jgi:hypothetical protein
MRWRALRLRSRIAGIVRVKRGTPFFPFLRTPGVPAFVPLDTLCRPFVMARLFRLLPLVLLLPVAACSSSRPRTPAPTRTPERPPAQADYRTTETFDVAAYPLEAPADPSAPVIVHDVPAALMNGTAPDSLAPPAPSRPDTPARPGALRTVTGYRVQVFQSSSKDEADRRVADAIAWWRRTQGTAPEVYTAYRAPYYRVRVGNFATRAEASRFAGQLTGTFPSALIVQDRVTVRQ